MASEKWKYLWISMILVSLVAILALIRLPDNSLHVIACDVGQGDAVLVTYKTSEILIDGGPNGNVLDCLDRHLPFWDRRLEVVIMTHPQTDHYTGLIDVFKNYKVGVFVAGELDSSNQSYQVLKTLVRGSGTRVVNPTTGMKVIVSLIQLDIVWPNKTFVNDEVAYISPKNAGNVLGTYTTKLDPNEFSIVAIMSFQDFRGIFTGDIGPETEEKIIAENVLKSVNYIKIPHHGSKNGLTENFLRILNPSVAVISVGHKNSYGHPNREILDMLTKYKVKTYRTDIMGDVEIVYDGEILSKVN